MSCISLGLPTLNPTHNVCSPPHTWHQEGEAWSALLEEIAAEAGQVAQFLIDREIEAPGGAQGDGGRGQRRSMHRTCMRLLHAGGLT